MHEGGLRNDRVGDDDGLPHGVADGGVAPGDVLHHAALRADLDVIARGDNSHEGHLKPADEVGQRVLKAERDCDAANAKGRHERVRVDAKTRVEDDTRPRCPNDAARDVDDDARAGQRVAVAVEEMLECAAGDARNNGRRRDERDGPQNALHQRNLKKRDHGFHGRLLVCVRGCAAAMLAWGCAPRGCSVSNMESVPIRAHFETVRTRLQGKKRVSLPGERRPRARPCAL